MSKEATPPTPFNLFARSSNDLNFVIEGLYYDGKGWGMRLNWVFVPWTKR